GGGPGAVGGAGAGRGGGGGARPFPALLGPAPPAQSRQADLISYARSHHTARGAAHRPGRLDRSPPAGRHPQSAPSRLSDSPAVLPPCLALFAQPDPTALG